MNVRKRLRREDVPFTWSASCAMPAFAKLAGVRYDLLFTDLDAIIAAYNRGKPMAEKLFGPDVAMGGPGWAGNSYGHINGLGAELFFPEDSEVGMRPPLYATLDEGLRRLKEDVDFTKQGMFPFYLDLWEKLKRAFPEHNIPFTGFKAEGPITTAWGLRHHDFFTDLIERPQDAKEFLRLVTESILKYRAVERAVNGQPAFSPDGTSLADDVAAMLSPGMWPEFVVPTLERYFSGQTSGRRTAHIEDLRAPHLRFLDEIALDYYDPSVSEKLTPALIRDNCSVPFAWRLNSTHYPTRTPDDVQRWVFEAAADGASSVTTNVAREMCDEQNAEKVKAFCRAAKEVQKRLGEGMARGELRGLAPV